MNDDRNPDEMNLDNPEGDAKTVLLDPDNPEGDAKTIKLDPDNPEGDAKTVMLDPDYQEDDEKTVLLDPTYTDGYGKKTDPDSGVKQLFPDEKRNAQDRQEDSGDEDITVEYYDDPDPEEAEKDKKLPRWAKILIGVGIGIFVLALAAFIAVKIYLGRVPRIEDKPRLDPSTETFETSSDAPEDTIDAEEVDWGKLYEDVMKDSDIKNILLIGNDSRPGDTGSARSDSMILCSINKKTNEITLVSFMRDMYVPIPGYSDNRINAAYTFGGSSLLKETIEHDFGIQIDNRVEINFEGFIKAMTAVGNINIELNKDEVEYLNRMGNAMNAEEGLPDSEWNLKEGMNSLTPEQALAYARTRYVGRSDFERTERQRKVITEAFKNINKLPLSEQVDFVNSILPYIATDMTDMEILGYVYYVATEGVNMGDSHRVPEDRAYKNETINKMMVLVPDLQKNSELLKEWLFKGIEITTEN